MITNLKVDQPQPIAGMEISVNQFNIKHFRLHKMLTEVSRMILFLLESDTNNSSAQVVARDARTINLGFKGIEKEWGFAKTHRNAPLGTLENSYAILLPKPSEVQRMKNRPAQCAAQELLNMANIMIFNDSASQQQWVGEGPARDIDDAILTAKTIVLSELGSGEPDTAHATGFAVGDEHPDYSRLGTLAPDVDLDKVTMAEPRVGAVQPSTVQDTLDVPSDLPAGGQ
jgi:hypothetical protein